jgi:hypothetical protein
MFCYLSDPAQCAGVGLCLALNNVSLFSGSFLGRLLLCYNNVAEGLQQVCGVIAEFLRGGRTGWRQSVRVDETCHTRLSDDMPQLVMLRRVRPELPITLHLSQESGRGRALFGGSAKTHPRFQFAIE